MHLVPDRYQISNFDGGKMFNSICLDKFRDCVECSFLHTNTIDAFTTFSYEFRAGKVYGLVSDFGCGSWALASCIGGRASKDCEGSVLLDNSEIPPSDLLKYSCFVYENESSDTPACEESTIRTSINRALNISGLPYTVEEIKEMFHLTDARIDRPLDCISGEKWLASMAIGFASGKKIFVYPWLNEKDVDRFVIAVEHGVIDVITKSGGIVVVPSGQKKILRRLCDRIVIMDRKHFKKR